MTPVATVSYDQAEGDLRALCDRIKGPGGNVDRIAPQAFNTSYAQGL